MSDQIKHECGIALIRLKKPLEYYHKKYGTALYGLNKLYIMLQKQRNRGQDGVGVATVKLDTMPGKRYISRKRNNSAQPIKNIFEEIHGYFSELTPEQLNDPTWLKDNIPFVGELILGHLRYGTHGRNKLEMCHPVLRQSNWKTRTLLMAGNFNLTNVKELFGHLVELGQHPKEQSDTVTILEKMGHFLDEEVQRLFKWYKDDYDDNMKVTEKITEKIDLHRVIMRSARKFDGGYALSGMTGHGDAFVMRDPAGIRPAFFYEDDEVVVVASERPVIQTAFNVHISKVQELAPGHALVIKKNGTTSIKPFIAPLPRAACSFERIYFSRGSDRDVYIERKRLGDQLVDRVLKAVNYDFENTVFSFVPNTAEVSFFGMIEGVEKRLNEIKKQKILALGNKLTEAELFKIMDVRPRVEKIVIKDVKLRTFITEDASRKELVSHVYDVTYGIVKNYIDTLVLIDDSIVRGTTLKESIISIASRLKPKKIIIVSSAPQIRYPDCYGIDMSKMKNFVAFKALVELLEANGKEDLLGQVYERCLAQKSLPKEEMVNEVAYLYEQFTQEEVSAQIAKIITQKDVEPEIQVIYQTIEGLQKACPDNNGDWYFSGNYPTPGGYQVINQAFINYMEKSDKRAYV